MEISLILNNKLVGSKEISKEDILKKTMLTTSILIAAGMFLKSNSFDALTTFSYPEKIKNIFYTDFTLEKAMELPVRQLWLEYEKGASYVLKGIFNHLF